MCIGCHYIFKTLGFTSDKVITVALSYRGELTPPPDKRGRHDPKHKISKDNQAVIEAHIIIIIII